MSAKSTLEVAAAAVACLAAIFGLAQACDTGTSESEAPPASPPSSQAQSPDVKDTPSDPAAGTPSGRQGDVTLGVNEQIDLKTGKSGKDIANPDVSITQDSSFPTIAATGGALSNSYNGTKEECQEELSDPFNDTSFSGNETYCVKLTDGRIGLIHMSSVEFDSLHDLESVRIHYQVWN